MPDNEFPKLKLHPFQERARDRPDQGGADAGARPFGIPPYAELCITSNYTFLTGASHPEEFVAQAAALGYHAVAITDTNTVAGVVRAHVAAQDAGLRFVLGCRLRLLDMPDASIFVYPTDMASYGRLCRLLTIGKRRAPKGQCHLWLADVEGLNAGLLAIVELEQDERWEGQRGPSWDDDGDGIEEAGHQGIEPAQPMPHPPAARAWDAHNEPPPSPADALLRRLRSVFDDDRLSLALRPTYGAERAEPDAIALAAAADLSARTGVPLVATNGAHYHAPERRMLQDVLTCIRHTCTLAQAGFRLHASAERHLKAPEEMHRLLSLHPDAIARALSIVDRTAAFTLDDLRYEYPDEVVPEGKTPQQHLADLTWKGAAERYPVPSFRGVRDAAVDPLAGVPAKVKTQIQHELALIDELGYARYFLTVHDLVRFARHEAGDRPILCQGRGAAANSAVCYCLGVTSVDPSRIDVLFERFVSRERNEPPDIDIDFEHERREEVIQYIYKKYGRDRAALTAEVISYRRRSAIRDVGKALGLSLDTVDRLAKDVEWWDGGMLQPARLREMGLNPDDPTLRWLARLTREILGFPRHLSQHVGGFVITRRALCELVPVENAAMPDRTVIEWDKDDIDAVGMLKVDCLGLGMLTCIRKALEFVNQEGIKGQRDQGAEGVDGSECFDKEQHHEGQDVSRPVDLAEGDGAGSTGVQGDACDATGRDVRAHEPDASGGVLRAAQHRRGVRAAYAPGVPQGLAHGDGLPLGVEHGLRAGDLHGDDLARQQGAGGDRRGGSNAAEHHHQARNQDRAGNASPQQSPAAIELRDPSAPPPLCPSAPSVLQLHTIPPEDPAVYAMIQKADTVGVFQIESRAQMSMLPRLKPACFYDLVIEVAIVRPGPIQGDMVHPYLRRRSGEEKIPENAHPAFREVLGKTLGVPLFQEQCMALAVKAAGFTPGEADQLRRAMAAWKRKGDQIVRFGMKMIAGMVERGIPREFAERCFEQVKGFSSYGFPESHAASFALLVYASAWLKCHHPAEFAAALINSLPMGFYAPAQIIRDAREHAVEVRPIDVNHSAWDCRIETGVKVSRCQGAERGETTSDPAKSHNHAPFTPRPLATSTPSVAAIRLGLRLITGLRQDEADRISDAVARHGPFTSMLDLWRASRVKAATMRRLAAADAFASMGLSRQEALWHARLLRDDHMPLFEGHETLEEPEPNLPDIGPEAHVVQDYNTTGLSLKQHPVWFAREHLAARGAILCEDLKDPARTPDGTAVWVAGLVLVRQRPGTASGVTFMTLEDETGIANLIIWRQVYQRHRRQAGARLLMARGRVQRQGQVVHVIVTRLRNEDAVLDGLAARSRDFR